MAADTKNLHDLMNHGGILKLFSGRILSLDSKGSPLQNRRDPVWRHLHVGASKVWVPRIYPQNMSHSLNSLKGGYVGDCIGEYHRGYIKGNTRSSGQSSYWGFRV